MRQSSLTLGAVVLSLALIGAFSNGARAQTTSHVGEGGKVFVGYLYGPPRNLNYDMYTHLCHAFVTAEADGTINQTPGVPNPEFVAEAHQHKVEVLASLGGWGWDEKFAAIVQDPAAEDRYVESVLKIVGEADYDGVDLDWEYPDTAEEVVGFERLTRRLRAGIDEIGQRKGRTMRLTMAAAANPNTLKWLDREFLLENMDWVNIMTYDFTGGWTNYAGHHSPLFASSKQPGPMKRSTELSMKYMVEERKVPADRLAVGIPLYGRAFAVAKPYDSTENAPRGRRLPRGDYASVARLLGEGGWTRQWDDETKNPWLVADDGSAVLGYDDAESVALKTEWAMEQGFRGVFFWQVRADRLPDGTNPLQEASRKAFDAAAKPATE